MPVTSRRTATRRQTGYTLIEILVASLLLTTGLIGVATMQVSGTRLNNSAYLRTQASIHAYDIIDRMRANLPAARAGNYDIALTGATPTATATVADIDLALWRTNITFNLPSGTSSVATTAGDPARVTVVVQWRDGRDVADVTNFTVVTDL